MEWGQGRIIMKGKTESNQNYEDANYKSKVRSNYARIRGK
jgi:hypothetical protein